MGTLYSKYAKRLMFFLTSGCKAIKLEITSKCESHDVVYINQPIFITGDTENSSQYQ